MDKVLTQTFDKFKVERWLTIFSLIAISIINFSLYFQLSTHEFLILDDTVYITNNEHIKTGLTPNNILWAFTSFDAEFWHPLTWLSYMIDTEIYGVIPGGYLFTNLFIHILNSILLFYLIKIMTSKIWESFFIASLFAIHPLHVEAVAWISERKELLCAFFWICASIAYYFYTQKTSLQRYLLVMLLYLMGIMSKSMIITFPFTLLLFDFWPLERFVFNRKHIQNRQHRWLNIKQAINTKNMEIDTKQLKILVIEKIPFFMMTFATGVVTIIAQSKGGGIVSIENYPLASRLINSIASYTLYIKKTIWADNLSVFYPVTDITTTLFFISLTVMVVISSIVLYFFLEHKFLLTGWLLFLGTFVPVIGIIKIGDFAMADRYTYMTINGLFIIFVFSVGYFISDMPLKNLWNVLIPLIILSSYFPNTFLQIQTWKNSKTLFNQSLKVTKDNFLAYHAMGELFASEGQMKEAAYLFYKAANIRPNNAALWVKFGRAALASENGNFSNIEVAEGSFSKAHVLAKDSPKPHFYLTCVYLAKNQIFKALEQFFILADKNSILKKDSEIYLLKNNFYHYYYDKSSNYNSQEGTVENLQIEYQDQKKREIQLTINRVLAKYGFLKSDNVLRKLVIIGYESWDNGLKITLTQKSNDIK